MASSCSRTQVCYNENTMTKKKVHLPVDCAFIRDARDTKELTTEAKSELVSVEKSISSLGHSLKQADADSEEVNTKVENVLKTISSVKIDPEVLINSTHIPEDAGDYEEELKDILHRIPDGWGRWIGVSRGWYKLIVDTDKKLTELFPNYRVFQVKEKFGTLRYYWDSGFDAGDVYETINPFPKDSSEKEQEAWYEELEKWHETPEIMALMSEVESKQKVADEIVRKAEAESSRICDMCGEKGHLAHRGYWYRTLCSTCGLEHNYKLIPSTTTVNIHSDAVSTAQGATKVIKKAETIDPNHSNQELFIKIQNYNVKEDLDGIDYNEAFIERVLDWASNTKYSLADKWECSEKSLNVSFDHPSNEAKIVIAQEKTKRGMVLYHGEELDS